MAAARPTYTPGVRPRTFSGIVTQRGILVWTCRHAHVSEQDARACAIGESEVLKCSYGTLCPKCKNEVEYTIEHLNVHNGDWVCEPVPRQRTAKVRRSV